MRNRSCLADIAMVITCFFWGLNVVITRNALGDAPESFRAFIFNGIRIPAAALLLFLTARLSGLSCGIRRQDIPFIVGLSFWGMFLFMMSFIAGISLTSASNVGVINATTPLFILFVSMLTGIERPTPRTVLGILIGFAGVLVLARRGGRFEVNPGDLLILASCVCWAGYTVYGKRILTRYNPMTVIAWVYLLTSLFQLPFVLWQAPKQSWPEISVWNWFAVGYSALGSLFLANTLYYFAVERIGPSRVGVYTNLSPIFTLLLAALIGGERITSAQIAGLAIIVSGIAVSNYRSQEHSCPCTHPPAPPL